jgi:methionine sulfoxide reductase catalytic subunit
MLIKKASDIRSSEITPKSSYMNRRKFLAGTALAGAATLAASRFGELWSPSNVVEANDKIAGIQSSPFSTTEKETPYKDITNYNNYYEFSTDKYEPARLAQKLKTRPWTVTIDGAVKKKQVLDVDSVIKMATPEERIYRHRCVEGWSIVVPWVGYSLSELIKRAEPLGKAKYVQFTTLLDMRQMPGQQTSVLRWPYTEGLRMDEAMHPLALLCFGLYGEVLPNQNGAPLRIVLPWKYGFKSAKAIVKITFTTSQPSTTWSEAAPEYYGFYSNVNPAVGYFRDQSSERRLGEFFRRKTLMFNGYDQVASLYNGMDLKKYY